MDIFKTIIAPIIVGLAVLAIAGFFSWDYADKWDYVAKMWDYISESLDFLIFTLILLTIGFIVGQIANTPKWFLFLIGPWMKSEPTPEPIQVENSKETDNSEQAITELLARMGFGNNTDTSKTDNFNTRIAFLKSLTAHMEQQKDKPNTNNEQEGQENE
ncbi:MAG: hypothetical protein K8953_08850 [Proteobacteria bacterium]|nr:hypothetical protein [Pseudomonadota bacterium]